MRRRPLPGDRLPRGEGRGLEPFGQQGEFLLVEGLEDVDPLERREATLAFPLEAPLTDLLVLLRDHQGTRRDGKLDPGPRKGVEDPHAHRRIHGLPAGDIVEAVAYGVIGAVLVEIGQDAVRRGVLRDAGGAVGAQGSLDGPDHLVGRAVVIDAERDLAHATRRSTRQAPQHRHGPLHEGAVGDDEGVAEEGLQRRLAPADLTDRPLDLAEADPVPRSEAALQLEDHPAEDVAQRILQGERHDGGHHRRGRQQPREVGPLGGKDREGRPEIGGRAHQVLQDGGKVQPQARQEEVEE